ncbi:zinc finger domain-containing ring-type protein [Colletotrichum plurivorum]|uniref:Zinc finger domain-containing ring-type protein n=2 Tax=Colletotrichum orchidearum species complex TaxID=2707337 RepID=A0A8H6NH95_9PEZI|nr:zinc finger domain-containing ring-type protein [Colletotrichum sojae]KAF6833582.1 zinc finger domain-containing ring-type protein [Colletotrichum plurivorum]
MSTQYEVEHNIKPGPSAQSGTRRVDMSSFTSFLANLTTDGAAEPQHQHTNPHATPTPVDAAALYHLLQQQFQTLYSTAPTDDNARFLSSLVDALESDIASPPTEIPGVRQEYLDSLDRVPKKSLGADEACPICAEKFLDDKYPLVVELPCHSSHRFDLECVSPWLRSKGSCPMCRKDLTKKKEPIVIEDDEENDDPDGLYA